MFITKYLLLVVAEDSLLKPQRGSYKEEELIHPSSKLQLLNEATIRDLPPGEIPKLKSEMTIGNWKTRFTELSELLDKETRKGKELDKDLQDRQLKFVKREMEYRTILEKLQSDLKFFLVLLTFRSKMSLEPSDRRILEPLYTVHGKILDLIEKIQGNTAKFMIDQERDIMRFFIKKIGEIKKEYEEERIMKSKKFVFLN